MIDIDMQGRSALRRSVQVYCETVLDKGFRRIGLRSRDLSVAGALIQTEDLDVAVDDEVILAFKAPRTSFWIDTRARVVRLLRGRRREDQGLRGIGVEFVEMDGIYRAVLRGSLQNFPPPAPTRPHRETTIPVVVALAD